jgi:hypothetical protein
VQALSNDEPDRLWSLSKAGGAPAVLAERDGSTGPTIHPVGDVVYWMAGNAVLEVAADGSITEVAVGCNSDFAYDAGAFFCPDGDDAIVTMTADGTPEVLAPLTATVTKIAIDDAWVYWFAFEDTPILQRVPRDGGEVQELWREPVGGPGFAAGFCLAPEGNDLYFSMQTEILGVPKAGGEPAVLATGSEISACPAVDETHVWFGDIERDTLSPAFTSHMRRVPH